MLDFLQRELDGISTPDSPSSDEGMPPNHFHERMDQDTGNTNFNAAIGHCLNR